MLINVLFSFVIWRITDKYWVFMRYTQICSACQIAHTRTTTLVLVGLPGFEQKPPQTESRNSDRWIMKKLHNFMGASINIVIIETRSNLAAYILKVTEVVGV